MPSSNPQRKYALTKIKAGDYLLPSNDGKTIWRFAQYEDGPSHGLDWPRDVVVWALWRWRDPVDLLGAVDTEDWEGWQEVANALGRRSDAIAEAMRIEAQEVRDAVE